MSDDSRRAQRRQQQPPPLAAAFASLSAEARRMASSLRPPMVAGASSSTSAAAAAATTSAAASTAAAPLGAARGATLKASASRLPGGEKMAVDLAKAAALLAGALAHHASRAAEAAAGALEGGKRRRAGKRSGDSASSSSSSSSSTSSSHFSSSGGGDDASSAALRGVPPPSSRAVALLLAEGAARERALDLRGAISKYEAAVAAARPGLDARALGAASKAWSDASYLDELGVEALTDEDKRALNARAIDRCREAALAAPESGLPHAACCISMGRMALWTPDSRGKARLAAAAREQASLATAKSPESDLAHHLLGRWHWEMAGLPRVVRAIAKLAYGASLPPGTYEDAAACYAKAASLAPRRLVHRVELGRSLARAGRFAEAESQLEAALALEVEDVNAHLQRADAEIMLAALRYDDKVRITRTGHVPPSSPSPSPPSSLSGADSNFPSGYSSAATRAKAWQGSLAPENLAAAALAAGVRDARRSAEEASAAAASASHAGGGNEGDLLRWLGVPPPVPAAFGMGKGATQGGVGPRRKRPSAGVSSGREEKQHSGHEDFWQRTPLGRLQQQLQQQQERQKQEQQQPRRRGHHHHHHHKRGAGGAGAASEKTPPPVPS